MAVIDRYLEAMVKHRAELLVFRSGATVSLVIGGAPRSISSRPATEEQITTVLSEALGPSFTPGLTGNRTFPYESEHGSVSLRGAHGQEGPTLGVQASEAKAPARPAASQARGTTPVSMPTV